MGSQITGRSVSQYLTNLNLVESEKILEFGFGPCNFSKILRDSFPNSHIVGYDKCEKFDMEKAKKFIDDPRNEDINETLRESEKGSYDIVTMGSLLMDPSFHFGFLEEGIFKRVVETMDYYLKSGGLFFIVFISFHHTNIREKNYLDRKKLIFFEAPKKDLSNPMINYDSIIKITEKIFRSIKNYSYSVDLIKNDDKIDKIKSCFDMFKTKKEYGISNHFDNPAIMSRAKEIDDSIKKYGIEYGYLNIITAFKE